MASYKGEVKFISETQELALVEETYLVQDQAITSTGIGTGNASNKEFSGTLQPIVEEGSLIIKVAGATKTAGEWSLATSTGLIIATSTGMGTLTGDGYLHTSAGTFKITDCNIFYGTGLQTGKVSIVNKLTGQVIIGLASAPSGGQAVTVSYERSWNTNYGPDRIRLLRGSFSSVTVGDIIYYDYTDTNTTTEIQITLKRLGQA